MKRRQRQPRIKVRVTTHEIAVMIHDLPQLMLRRSDVLAFQAWIKSEGPARPMYFIDVTLTGNRAVTSDYDTREVWEEILTALAASRPFDERFGERT